MTLQNYSGRLFFANRVSLSCTVSANWWPKAQKFPRRMGVTSPGVGFTNPGVGFTNPGVGFTTRRLEKTNRRVGNTNRRLRKTTRRLVRAISPTMPMVWIFPFLRAHVYAFDFPKKVFTPSHIVCFLLIFKVFGCEGLLFRVFTRAAKWLWRVDFASLHTAKLLKFRREATFTPLTLWTLENPTLHTWNDWKSIRNSHYVKGWMLFWG